MAACLGGKGRRAGRVVAAASHSSFCARQLPQRAPAPYAYACAACRGRPGPPCAPQSRADRRLPKPARTYADLCGPMRTYADLCVTYADLCVTYRTYA